MGSICNMECLALATRSKVISSSAARALPSNAPAPHSRETARAKDTEPLAVLLDFLKPNANIIRCLSQQQGPMPVEINTCQLPTCWKSHTGSAIVLRPPADALRKVTDAQTFKTPGETSVLSVGIWNGSSSVWELLAVFLNILPFINYFFLKQQKEKIDTKEYQFGFLAEFPSYCGSQVSGECAWCPNGCVTHGLRKVGTRPRSTVGSLLVTMATLGRALANPGWVDVWSREGSELVPHQQ